MSAPPFAWLLTPGPLSTTDTVKQAMLHDWGSWDGDFRALTAEIRARLHRIAGAGEAHTVVPVQGSGTTAVEAALLTLVGRTGRILILVNGAYGRRMVDICTRAGLPHAVLAVDETQPVTAEAVARAVATEGPFTHAAVVLVETSTGLLNPVEDMAAVLAPAGVRLIIDAMSALGEMPLDPARVPFDALVFSTNKCLEGVPGLGFVLARRDALEACHDRTPAPPLTLDLADQWLYLERTGQFRFTPPTHVLAAFRQALDEYDAEGGGPGRLARYRRQYETLIQAMEALGVRPLLPEALRSPIIVTFRAPQDPAYSFPAFYEAMKRRGFLIYPGKMTAAESFRLGCIGALADGVMTACATACADSLREIGVTRGRLPA